MAVIGATQLEPTNILGSYVQGLEAGRQARAQRMQEEALLGQTQRETALRNFLSSADLSKPDVRNELLRFGKPGAELAASIEDIAGKRATAEKTGLDIKAAEMKMADDNYGRFQKMLGDFAYGKTAPTKDRVIDELDFLIAQGVVAPEFKQFAVSTLPDDPAQLQTTLRSQFLSQIPPAERAKLFVPKSQEVFAQDVAERAAGAPMTQIAAFKPAAETIQEEAVKNLTKTYDQLKTAKVDIQNLRNAATLARTEARKYMGTGGQAFLSAAKFLKNRLGVDVDTKAIVNAEAARTTLFQNVLNNLRKLDAQPSQQQQMIMQEALGSLDTDPDALEAVVQVYEDVIRGRVEQHNAEVAQVKENKIPLPYDLAIKIPEKLTKPAIGGPPPEAVAELRANPALKDKFDEIFGAGAANKALKGGK